MTVPGPPAAETVPGRSGRSGRYAALDVARGLAILGTLATNVWIFTASAGLAGYVVGAADGTPPGWRALELVWQQLATGKFLGLLTVLFGVGLELQRRSALRAGRPWPGRYPVRAGLLLLDGTLHFLLLAEFDVLMGYAVVGLVVAYLLATSERAQRTWFTVALAVHALLLAAVGLALALVPPGDVSPEEEADLAAEAAVYADGSFLDLVAHRLDNLVLFRAEPVFITALTVAAFLLGARLLRAGLLEDRGAGLRRRLLVAGAVALVVDLALGLGWPAVGVVLTRYGTAPVVALGLLALVVEVVRRRGAPGWARRRLAEVGRTALSCYVLQNLVASVLCYGWGLGLAARVGEAGRVPLTVGVYGVVVAVVLLAAHLWVRRWGRGPLEAVTQRAARALGAR